MIHLTYKGCAYARALHPLSKGNFGAERESEETFRLARATEVLSKLPNLVFWQGLEPPDAALGRN